jgi:PIN domain nuclease of toxin-antitoxin system
VGRYVKLLLDTHTLLWWLADDPALSAPARKAISARRNTVLVSAASAWDIATKHRIGKLPGVEPVINRFHELIHADGFEVLAITHVHALRAGAYPHAHRDPFDRLLAAQAELEGAKLVSCDAALDLFPVKRLW